MSMNAVEYYYSLEEKKKFKDWTKSGLEFLLKDSADILTMSQIKIIEDRLEQF